jgi:hypothetical protein
MFHKEESSSRQQKQGQSCRYRQSQRFIPPTHPAYLVTPHFQAQHVLALQEECDRNYIAIGMQTSRKKLMRVPELPQDKFFIIVDDSTGPLALEGEFLTLNSKVVSYPLANSLADVL